MGSERQLPTFADLPALAGHLRQVLQGKITTILLYAYNGTGKTRLSMAFKDIGKQDESRDTLYFNAFTEDLFHWDNDLEGDSERRLTLNADSRFFAGLAELEMDTRIRLLLRRYADFDFRIDTQDWVVYFSRTVDGQDVDNIKVSRGEENLFVWCFFLAVMQLAMDPEIEAYSWVRYVYIDDPISSLDEHNIISLGCHLTQL
ncbi:MAG: anticodon nuclease, partial [Halopseudomonas aestusnigri]|nr:anticodon nuclease [Halopseudomonas aestusnigri]